MLSILRETIRGDMKVIEYTKDGETVIQTVKVPTDVEGIQNPELGVFESLEQKVDRLEKQVTEDNLVQFEVLATIYEELLSKEVCKDG
ncbi:hypothetical protein ACIQZM_18030 [Peribacillus sp. NPDC097206]|uniref:hypothetical protein n=1 Tax=unclassified Peribacillus TaxID=2675266 RepID=UPI003830644D